jgi:hypothetical protein
VQEVVDTFPIKAFEALARNFVGIHARTMCLWSGGVYHLANWLGHPDDQRRAAARAAALWPRVLCLQELSKTRDAPREVRDFEAECLWIHSWLWQEMHSLIAGGGLPAAKSLARQVFSSIYHEKGMEDTFKHARRLCTKGSENRTISVERLYNQIEAATRLGFPDVGQESVTANS